MPIRLGGRTGEHSRAGFRGDHRAPDEIFRAGFSARDMLAEIRYRPFREEVFGPGRPSLFDMMAGDLDPDSGVSFSARVLAAALFPPRMDETEPGVSDTWVYAIVVDRGVFNTALLQAQQALDGLRNWQTMMGRAVDDAAARCTFWPLYAQEMATRRVPNTHVVGALRVTRSWNGGTYKGGASLVFHGPPIFNFNCAIDTGTRRLMQDILTEYANDGAGDTPETESGFRRSTRR